MRCPDFRLLESRPWRDREDGWGIPGCGCDRCQQVTPFLISLLRNNTATSEWEQGDEEVPPAHNKTITHSDRQSFGRSVSRHSVRQLLWEKELGKQGDWRMHIAIAIFRAVSNAEITFAHFLKAVLPFWLFADFFCIAFRRLAINRDH